MEIKFGVGIYAHIHTYTYIYFNNDAICLAIEFLLSLFVLAIKFGFAT